MTISFHSIRPLRALALVAVLYAGLGSPLTQLTAQERTKKPAEQELGFAESLDAAKAAMAAGKAGAALAHLQHAMVLARRVLQTKVLEAMPAAPDGFTRLEAKKQDEAAAANPFAALTGTTLPIEVKYKAKEGREHFDAQVLIDSPLVKMLAMAFSTAGLNPKLEVIKYGAHKGLLEEQGKDRLKLTIVLADKHAITVEASGVSDEQLFKLFDQAFVDKLAAILQ